MSTTLVHKSDDGSAVQVTTASDDALDLLGALSTSARQLAAWRLEVVARARQQGRSWAEVGHALGMSKQAAWEQFNDDVTELLDRVRSGSGLDEAAAMQLANEEIRALRSERPGSS